MRVLVVEDAAPTRAVIVAALVAAGFAVEEAADADTARRCLSAQAPDVVVLDIVLPDGSGLDLLREIARGAGTPVVMLSSRTDEFDRVLGLELGAEDYVPKPFYPRELVARVAKAAKRGTTVPARLEFACTVVNVMSREVLVRGEPLEMTAREFDLLVHLASNPRKAFSRNDLLREVWRSSSDWQSERTVTEHVRRLRQKLEPDPARPRLIVTVAGVGYRFDG